MLLHSVEVECSKVGLGMNAKKPKGMTFNVDFETIQTFAVIESGEQDFNTWGQNRDLQTCKALDWLALNKMTKIWKNFLPGLMKLYACSEQLLSPFCCTDVEPSH